MDSEEERKRLPEHKWIVNLERFLQTVQFTIDHYVDDFDCINCERDRNRRRLLIAKYKAKVTPCEKRTFCSTEDCPYFHSKADRLTMKHIKENEQDRLFYLDQFHDLISHLQPFIIKDIASLIRDYCCNPAYVLRKEGLRWSTSLYLFRLVQPDRRKPMQEDRFQRCQLCEQQYDQYDSKKTLYNLTKDFDENNQDHYMFDKDCGRKYLGLNTVSISLSIPMHGWKFSVQKRLPEHKWYINLERYIGKQNEKPFYDFLTHEQCQEWESDMRRWKALLKIYEKRIRSHLDCSS